MNLFVEHDAASLARLVGAAPSACDSVILQYGEPSKALGCVRLDNPLADDWVLDAESPGTMVVTWSGTLGKGLYDAEPRNWGATGRSSLERFCEVLEPQLKRHSRRLCFHPHARHILSDAPSCRSFIARWCCDEGAFAVALAPASMLEPAMLERVDEHLERQFQALGGVCAMLLLSDVHVVVDESGDRICHPVPLGEGCLPRDQVRSLIRAHIPPTVPVVLQASSLSAQISWLGL